MKVVLKPTVIDAIYERIDDAKRRNREVDYILVTSEEYAEIVRWSSSPQRSAHISPSYEAFQTISLENLHQKHATKRFASQGKLLGFTLYVVPPEYIPE